MVQRSSHPRPHHLSRRHLGVAAVLALGAAGLAGCSAAEDVAGGLPGRGQGSQDATETTPVALTADVEDGAADVPVDHVVTVSAAQGTLSKVSVRSAAGWVPGRLSEDGTRWTATGLLEPGTRYAVRAVGSNAEGQERTLSSGFTTQDLTLAEQTYPSVAPLAGETVGVGMPVVVTFDVAVKDRAAFERRMKVESSPRQNGSWHWFSDKEVHWRPARYWTPGTEVTVKVDVNGVAAGGGVYGQEDRDVAFTVGASHVHRVDAKAHTMKTYVDGKLVRTMPISAGKPGFETRSGTKVIMEKFRSKRMDAATTGIQPGDPEYYNLSNVEYAMRVTNSGEFLHAAPWSLGSQGSANVSHGCVGMSTEDARWVFDLTRRGDVVEVTGTDRRMTLDNGWGDWNESFGAYRDGSALA